MCAPALLITQSRLMISALTIAFLEKSEVYRCCHAPWSLELADYKVNCHVIIVSLLKHCSATPLSLSAGITLCPISLVSQASQHNYGANSAHSEITTDPAPYMFVYKTKSNHWARLHAPSLGSV